jgi:hypothetical protein
MIGFDPKCHKCIDLGSTPIVSCRRELILGVGISDAVTC